ncbi:MAG: Fe-S cluster domain-containing protein [Candidatus Mcinerneyibacterium aminivorans]|uniref:Ion-translocating oxidoreductase complex subunit B n=1 Tax=Candidatus Mcinerneyibacterium aminivorans TaxID=2703815 RepID=A0A5D0MCG0_9BACT|nr:MAG: Fe-S cluster domain-containing protein [Candidatus Mcinerneyibacterium aminivorans]
MSAGIILGIIGTILGIVLAIASKIFHVEIDPRIEEVEEILPQANCGACGFAGCASYAEAVVKGNAEITDCTPGGEEVSNKIAEILGVEKESKDKKVAIIHCNANFNQMDKKFEYEGIDSCRGASLALGGDLICEYGCLGYYDCKESCPFDAIYISENRVPRIDEDKCTACGVCIEKCPKNLIDYKPYSKEVDVLCKSKEKGAEAKKKCETACIACSLCEKNCPVDAIHVKDNLAVIDYDKCISCGKCAEVCPTNAIEDKVLENTDLEKRDKPKIIDDKCVGCTICAKNCPVEAIEGEVKEVHKIDKSICVACGICVSKCPQDAIDWKHSKNKE